MIDATLLKDPSTCTERERQEFARLVRRGFDGSDEGLDGRIRAAQRLAFHYVAGGTLGGIAALKAPGERLREGVFEKANVPVSPMDYTLELGWVFVAPAHRRNGVAMGLCRQLVASVTMTGIYATTRTHNAPMVAILLALNFERVGRPYPYRNREHVVFLRSPMHAAVAPV